jgi:endonuclease YncB( thermonuclease family)
MVTDAPNAATWILADRTIRLWGIKPQPSNSVASLVNWVRAKGSIECVPRAKTGRYQCFTATGEDIAEAALLAGVARAGDRAPAAYRNAEAQARRQEKGLWGRR